MPNRSMMVQVRKHCERARAAGATILSEPTDHEYGERQYAAKDFHGMFGISRKPSMMYDPRVGAVLP